MGLCFFSALFRAVQLVPVAGRSLVFVPLGVGTHCTSGDAGRSLSVSHHLRAHHCLLASPRRSPPLFSWLRGETLTGQRAGVGQQRDTSVRLLRVSSHASEQECEGTGLGGHLSHTDPTGRAWSHALSESLLMIIFKRVLLLKGVCRHLLSSLLFLAGSATGASPPRPRPLEQVGMRVSSRHCRTHHRRGSVYPRCNVLGLFYCGKLNVT